MIESCSVRHCVGAQSAAVPDVCAVHPTRLQHRKPLHSILLRSAAPNTTSSVCSVNHVSPL